ncbi:protein of unknown function (plasmid) [Cupriavidus neocaledonicus]|uniref:Uncharacterized protein n=1 Tax=Cupriavidus neocaledonicus TaxID=1040979 RepID=A0A375HV98_9BURK|nr:hypothetical protein CBM2605_B50044 [Cupriavidus neocaledonicus]SPD60794.1 protein of unknown function [Cupriavidus neocaledonicus]
MNLLSPYQFKYRVLNHFSGGRRRIDVFKEKSAERNPIGVLRKH